MTAVRASRKKESFHHKNLREEMIAVTAEEIAENGAADLNIKALAKKLGVTHVAIYRHFDGKAGVLSAVAERGFEDLRIAQLAAKDAAADDPLKALIDMGLVYIDFAAQNRNLFSFMFSYVSVLPGAKEKAPDASPTQTFAVLDQIERCQAEGLLIDEDPLRILGAIMCAPHGYAMLTIHGDNLLGVEQSILPDPRSLLMLTLDPFLNKSID